MLLGQALQSRIDRRIVGEVMAGNGQSVNGNAWGMPATLSCMMCACIVDQDCAHRSGGSSKEMSTVDVGFKPAIRQADIGLVNERGWLKRMIQSFIFKIFTGEASKFAVGDLRKLGEFKWS